MIMQAWDDFGAFVATGANVQLRPSGEHGDVLTLAEVASAFDVLQKRYEAGDRASLWDGIRAICRYNVPAPYWLADALLQVDKDLHTMPESAHELLGLGKLLPLSQKRAGLARQKLFNAQRLWNEVMRQHAARFHAQVQLRMADGQSIEDAIAAVAKLPKLSKSRAVAQARAKLRFPYQQRQAITMYDEQDARQQADAAPYRRVKRVQR